MNAPDSPRRVGPIAWLLVWPIRCYQVCISRFTPPTCRYYPCCSNYAIGALRTHGAIKGLLLTAWRLLRCNPWSQGGVDYPPPRGAWRSVPPVYDDDAELDDGCFDDGCFDEEHVIPEWGRAMPPAWTANGADPNTDETARPHEADAPTAGRTAA